MYASRRTIFSTERRIALHLEYHKGRCGREFKDALIYSGDMLPLRYERIYITCDDLGFMVYFGVTFFCFTEHDTFRFTEI